MPALDLGAFSRVLFNLVPYEYLAVRDFAEPDALKAAQESYFEAPALIRPAVLRQRVASRP